MKHNFTQMLRMIIHLCANIGVKKSANEDIEDQLKDKEMGGMDGAAAPEKETKEAAPAGDAMSIGEDGGGGGMEPAPEKAVLVTEVPMEGMMEIDMS